MCRFKKGDKVIIKKTGECGYIEQVNYNPYLTFMVSSYRVKLDVKRADGYDFTICSKEELEEK